MKMIISFVEQEIIHGISCLCLGVAQATWIWISNADRDLLRDIPDHAERKDQNLSGWTVFREG